MFYVDWVATRLMWVNQQRLQHKQYGSRSYQLLELWPDKHHKQVYTDGQTESQA